MYMCQWTSQLNIAKRDVSENPYENLRVFLAFLFFIDFVSGDGKSEPQGVFQRWRYVTNYVGGIILFNDSDIIMLLFFNVEVWLANPTLLSFMVVHDTPNILEFHARPPCQVLQRWFLHLHLPNNYSSMLYQFFRLPLAISFVLCLPLRFRSDL